jgi:hypothetical protein
MFGKSEYFASQGVGVGLQDAFKLPNDVIDPSKNNHVSYLKWTTQEHVQGLLADCISSKGSSLRCYSAIHNTVWEFDNLWTMMAQNPMSAIQGASDDDIAKAKKVLQDFVTLGGKTNASLNEPIMLSTASILAVARGFGKLV